MNRFFTGLVIFTLCFVFAGSSYANNSKPITADKAFDSVATQTDPNSGKKTRVAMIDLRTAAEYYWVGAPAQVDMIVTKDGSEISPFLGKTTIDMDKELITYTEMKNDKKTAKTLKLKNIKTMFKNPVSINIPYMSWDEATQSKVKNDNFKKEIEALAGKYDVLILMCRSGKRSSKCEFNFALFKSVYEVDHPKGKNGKGGFQGTSYKEAYNGYRGYPGRKTESQKADSVSWNDYGLPVHIGWKANKS